MIVVETTISDRLDRVVGDVNDLLHAGDSPDAKARASRWVALTLADIAQARHWAFLDRRFTVDLLPGADVITLIGDYDKLVAIYVGGKRLARTTLQRITEARLAAAESDNANGGTPTDYAVEANRSLHLWPAPVGVAVTFSADAATDVLTLASGTAALGKSVRLTSTAQLPAPLDATKTYFALPVTGSQIKLAATVDDVLTGTAIDLTSAGSGVLTLTPLTPLTLLYTVPMDVTVMPDHFEPMLVHGALGLYGRHFDRDTLTDAAPEFERRYRENLRRAGVLHHDFERVHPHEDLVASETFARAPNSALGLASSFVLPASITGIGYMTIEIGDNPLVVS